MNDYNRNDSEDPSSHKGQWVFYNFDYVYGGAMITARPNAVIVSTTATLLPSLTPPDVVSDEPETVGKFFGIPVDLKTFLPITVR